MVALPLIARRSPVVHRPLILLACACLIWAWPIPASAGGKVTSPKEQFGFPLGDDYCLANYTQMVDYWRKLERESDRMKLQVIGQSEEGRDILMAIVTAPGNLKDLARYRDIARRLALAEGLDDAAAQKLAADGKTIVWIDGGLHATETLGVQQLLEMVYQMVSRDDPETRRFLDDVIVLCCCPNPDGLDLVANWYMREADPKKRSLRSLPRLYQKYIGHDNNRDFYMVTQKETEAVCRVFYHEWFPQIVYNHHQTGPPGTVLFAPPFRDPFNYHFDPLVVAGIDLVGAAMHNRFIAEGKPGATMRRGANYSTWFNGGLRTSVYFHNMIGLLTETIGSPTPLEIPLDLKRQLASADLLYPIAPQRWHFRQSVDYSITANRAVLDIASRYRETLLFQSYRMGRNSIERGSRDHWTIRPDRIAAAQAVLDGARGTATSSRPPRARSGQTAPPPAKASPDPKPATPPRPPDVFRDVLHDPAHRDPRGYILPADQPDFGTATKFVNTLIKNGITVHRATSTFSAGGKTYPAGSYVMKTAQAFRPHILDMFEPQDHPDDFAYPGGPPIAPYDAAGYTLAFQMGVQFDRILDGFDGPFEKIDGLAKPPAGPVAGGDQAVGFLLSPRVNDSFLAVNRLTHTGEKVSRLTTPLTTTSGKTYPAGTFYVARQPETLTKLARLAAELGLNVESVTTPPGVSAVELHRPRIGLWDTYGGSMASGWVRWLLERFEFDFRVVYAPELDRGDLAARFDVLIFVGGAIPRADRGPTAAGPTDTRNRPDPATGTPDAQSPERGGAPPDLKTIPKEYHDRVGRVTADKTVPQLRQFLDQGGHILTIGSSTALAAHLGLPIGNALVERRADGSEPALTSDKFYIPGSVLRARVDDSHPLAWGMSDAVDVYFAHSPVFRMSPDATLKGVRPVAWFDNTGPLRSGWAWGQHYLKDGIAVLEAEVGKGRLVLFGPEITFRAQPHGTFKLLFNGIYNPRP
jgi:hypothetical protein